MRPLMFSLIIFFSSHSFANSVTPNSIDPDLVDPEMTQVMYIINPNDIKTTSYRAGQPSTFDLKLCKACQIKSYKLKIDAELLNNGLPLAMQDLTIKLIKKKFDLIQLGIDRTNNTVTYIYLGGISELSTGEYQ